MILLFLLVFKGFILGKIGDLMTLRGQGDGDLPIFW